MNAFREWLILFVQQHPVLLRNALRLGKRLSSKLSRSAITSADAVREVFSRPSEFLMGQLNAPKLKTGPFLLGMDPGTSTPPGTSGYEPEKTVLVEALQATVDDLPPIVMEASRHVLNELITAARRQTTDGSPSVVIDLGHDYAERIYARAFAHHFGLPLDDADNPLRSAHFDTPPGEYTLMRFIRTLGATIGSGHPAPFGLEERALQVGPELHSYLQRVVENHFNKSHEQSPHTIIGHLCGQVHRFADQQQGIVRSVAGMLCAGASFSKMFASIVDELLRHDQLRAFKAAVDDGDEPKMLAYILEAVRFRPPFPMLVRSCPATSVVRGAPGDPPCDFAAGSTLVFFPLAAMFDPARVTRPEEFVLGRPEQIYMHFGGAPRECIGKPLIERFFLPMFRVLFEQVPDLVNAKPGKFRFDSVALESYHIGPVTIAAVAKPQTTPP